MDITRDPAPEPPIVVRMSAHEAQQIIAWVGADPLSSAVKALVDGLRYPPMDITRDPAPEPPIVVRMSAHEARQIIAWVGADPLSSAVKALVDGLRALEGADAAIRTFSTLQAYA